MKKMKKGEWRDLVGCLIYILIPAVIVAIAIRIAYLISMSDLPDWFKFWLLK